MGFVKNHFGAQSLSNILLLYSKKLLFVFLLLPFI